MCIEGFEALKGLDDVGVEVIAALANSDTGCGEGTLTGYR
jgi:hypothetical protein